MGTPDEIASAALFLPVMTVAISPVRKFASMAD
jgi:hypothetical protein